MIYSQPKTSIKCNYILIQRERAAIPLIKRAYSITVNTFLKWSDYVSRVFIKVGISIPYLFVQRRRLYLLHMLSADTNRLLVQIIYNCFMYSSPHAPAYAREMLYNDTRASQIDKDVFNFILLNGSFRF